MDLADRIQLILFYFLTAVLAVAGFSSLYQHEWFNAFLSFLCILLSYVPAFIGRNYRLVLPIELDFAMVLFVFLTVYMGSVEGYYYYYWWWDGLLHGASGVLLGIVGFIIVYILRTEDRFNLEITPLFVGLFTFLFAVTIGTLWEVFEYLVDQFQIALPMQDDNDDTMKDLISDSLGAFALAVVGYFYIKKVPIPIVQRIVNKFVEKNPTLFWRIKHRSRNFFKRRADSIRIIRGNTVNKIRSLLSRLKGMKKPREK